MSTMEYRLWITVPDMAFEAEELWEPFIERMEKRHGELGPILTWDGKGGTIVIVAVDTDNEAHAVAQGIEAVADALNAAGLGDHYPASVEIEFAESELQAA
jgi:hypothetical protein